MESKRTSGLHDQRDLEPTISPEQSKLLKNIYEVCCDNRICLVKEGEKEGVNVSFRDLVSYASKLELKDFEDLAKK